MKKVMPILLVLGVLALIFQFIINMFIDNHDVKYSIKTNDNEYSINEKFYKVKNEDVYDFSVIDKEDNFYSFSYTNDFNNQKEVIKDIKYFTTKDLKCIFPIYRRGKYGDISCIYDGEQISYSYLKQINNYDIGIITDKLSDLGYKHDSWRSGGLTSVKSDDNKIKLYKNDIYNNYIFTMWNYKGIYILKDNKVIDKQLIDNDQYESNFSILVGKYYVVLNCLDDSHTISDVFYYNIDDMGKGEFSLSTPISTDSYFNGIYADKLYITDLDNEKQYVLDPKYQSFKEIGNKNDGYKILKGDKLVAISKSEFFENEVYFSNPVINKKIISKYGNVEVRKSGNFYYFEKDGVIYRAHESNTTKAVKLFKFDKISDWKIKNGDVLAVVDDTLYFYSDNSGLIPIAVNNELRYNYKNISDFWKG